MNKLSNPIPYRTGLKLPHMTGDSSKGRLSVLLWAATNVVNSRQIWSYLVHLNMGQNPELNLVGFGILMNSFDVYKYFVFTIKKICSTINFSKFYEHDCNFSHSLEDIKIFSVNVNYFHLFVGVFDIVFDLSLQRN